MPTQAFSQLLHSSLGIAFGYNCVPYLASASKSGRNEMQDDIVEEVAFGILSARLQ
jgi:hypothetical protein